MFNSTKQGGVQNERCKGFVVLGPTYFSMRALNFQRSYLQRAIKIKRKEREKEKKFKFKGIIFLPFIFLYL